MNAARNAWAIVGGVATLSGCFLTGSDDHERPTVTEIRVTADNAIRITLSEDVTIPNGLETGAFRLSAAVLAGDETIYYALELEGDVGGGSTTGTGSSTGDGSTTDGSTTAAVLGPDDELADALRPTRVYDVGIKDVRHPINVYAQPIEDQIEIAFFDSIGDTPGCLRLQSIPITEGGLFLHYRPLSTGDIVDLGGNALQPLAPHWVEDEALATKTVTGELPALGGRRFRLECP